jgi:hypothetical protein
MQLAATNKRTLVSRRADSLAERIKAGAAGLAAFAETLSAEQWRTPLSATDPRPIGVVIHHVATVYPIEVGLARKIASGQPITDVTWELLAELNAKHAKDFGEVTKEVALALLARNSSEAAIAVSAFTDDELDTAAPFSLAFGAPVTAQFVIEDHPVRHSWHHLARMRTALNLTM